MLAPDIKKVEGLPYELYSPASQEFTVYDVAANAAAAAVVLKAGGNAELPVEFVVFERIDGRFNVTMIDHEDELCMHV